MHKFEFLGGQLALDFVNTASAREVGPLKDRLTSYADLVAWAEQAHALPDCVPSDLLKAAEQHPRIAARTLDEARALREALYRVFTALASGPDAPGAPADDMALLNAQFRRANAHRTLCCHKPNRHGAPTFEWSWDQGGAELDRVLWPVVLAAAELLTSGDPARLKLCGGHDCSWLFLDQSKNRSRRWCSMQDCGNRVKAKRHYASKRVDA